LLGERGDVGREMVSIDDRRIEVVGDPLFELDVALVVGIVDRLEELGIAPGTADVFGSTAAMQRSRRQGGCSFDCGSVRELMMPLLRANCRPTNR